MSGPAAPGIILPVDPRIADQLRRVRWRRRLRELQRVLYPVVAAAGFGGAAATLAALRTTTATFLVTAAAAGLSLSLTLAVTLALGARAAWRRRLPQRGVAVWVDDTAALDGALATFLGLRAASSFAPLLAARNLALLPRWTPERVVPAVVPVASCVVAAAGLATVALVVGAAPFLVPPLPTVVVRDTPMAAVDARGLRSRPDRLVLGRDGAQPRGGDGMHDGAPTAGVAGNGAGDPTLSWPAAVQERVRRELWGRDWDRLRDALARAAAAQAPAALARSSAPRREHATGDGSQAGTEDARDVAGRGDADATAATEPGQPDGAGRDGGDATASAAGDGTDPRLFGDPHADVHAGADPFALAIAARVRTRSAGPRPPSGETPPASPDERPELATRPRPDDPVHRMAVPPAYEPIVRALFAREGTMP